MLTEPFVAHRVAARVTGMTSEQWSELGEATDLGIERVQVGSRLIAPGSPGARAFHHIPWLGLPQQAVYRALASERRPDIVHAHYLTTGYLAASTGCPLVVSAYGFDVSVLARRPLWRRAFRQLADVPATVLVEGPHMQASVVALGFPQMQTRVVRIAAGHDTLAFSAPRTLLDGGPRFLAAGRLVEKKGLGIAVAAFADVGRIWPEARLEIIGAGPLEADLRSRANSSLVGDRIAFLGALSRDEYIAHVEAADILLAPSVTARNGDSEGGAPTTILDAQAVGTIAVGSTHADIPFLIEDGRTGFLAEEGSVGSLVGAIQRALGAQDRWPRIAEAARRNIVTYHSDAVLAAALGEVYLQVIG